MVRPATTALHPQCVFIKLIHLLRDNVRDDLSRRIPTKFSMIYSEMENSKSSRVKIASTLCLRVAARSAYTRARKFEALISISKGATSP